MKEPIFHLTFLTLQKNFYIFFGFSLQNVTKGNKTLKRNVAMRVNEEMMVDVTVTVYFFLARHEIRMSLSLAVTCEIKIV